MHGGHVEVATSQLAALAGHAVCVVTWPSCCGAVAAQDAESRGLISSGVAASEALQLLGRALEDVTTDSFSSRGESSTRYESYIILS